MLIGNRRPMPYVYLSWALDWFGGVIACSCSSFIWFLLKINLVLFQIPHEIPVTISWFNTRLISLTLIWAHWFETWNVALPGSFCFYFLFYALFFEYHSLFSKDSFENCWSLKGRDGKIVLGNASSIASIGGHGKLTDPNSKKNPRLIGSLLKVL